MPAKKSREVLSHDIAQVVELHHNQHKSLQVTGNLIGVSRQTVKNIKKTPLYHELATQAFENQGKPIEEWTKNLALTAFEGENERNKLTATIKGLDIFGAEPPKEQYHVHTLQTASDAEIDKELGDALQGINGNKPNQIAGSLDAGQIIASTVPKQTVEAGQSGTPDGADSEV